MRILVIVKEIIDTESKVILNNSKQIDKNDIEYAVNIYDEYALEEAISLKERFGGEVVIYSVCRYGAMDIFRYTMAMGADRAVLIKSEKRDSKTVSELLAQAISREDNDFDLILGGWAGIDYNNGQVPGRLSHILDIPIINTVVKLDIYKEKILCEREGEIQQEIIESRLPALVTVQRGINMPRQPTAHNLMEPKMSRMTIIDSFKTNINEDLEITYEYLKSRKDAYLIEEEPTKAVELLVQKLMEDKVL